ncbi:MAG TPA: PilZ domain-containing protein [Geobacteraceae bacterium]|nr:PilZ domain-containing protein [Geobacteraceae bacterium]
MVEKRRLQRVRYVSKSVLFCNDARHEGRLENLSPSGALASFEGTILARPGNTGVLDLHVDGHNGPLRFEVEVAHSGFSMVGMKFIGMDPGMKERLQELVERLTVIQERPKCPDCS